MYGLWTLCSGAEKYTDEGKRKRVRWWVDDGMVRECREGGHPAYGWPQWEAWEILACLRIIAALMNSDPKIQMRMARES